MLDLHFIFCDIKHILAVATVRSEVKRIADLFSMVILLSIQVTLLLPEKVCFPRVNAEIESVVCFG